MLKSECNLESEEDALDLSNKDNNFMLDTYKKQLLNIKKLLIVDSSQFSKDTRKLPLYCEKLQILDISKNYIGDYGASDLSQIVTLRHLTVNNCGIGTCGGLMKLFRLPRLWHLSLDNNPFDHVPLLGLYLHNYSLQSLSLQFCPNLTDEAEKVLSRCALRSLQMTGSGISMAARERILQSNKLNYERCQAFVQEALTFFQMANMAGSLLNRIPKDILLDIAYFVASDLTKQPMQIAACVVLIAHNVQERKLNKGAFWQTHIDHNLKMFSLNLVQRFYPQSSEPDLRENIPDYYLDETAHKIFHSSKV